MSEILLLIGCSLFSGLILSGMIYLLIKSLKASKTTPMKKYERLENIIQESDYSQSNNNFYHETFGVVKFNIQQNNDVAIEIPELQLEEVINQNTRLANLYKFLKETNYNFQINDDDLLLNYDNYESIKIRLTKKERINLISKSVLKDIPHKLKELLNSRKGSSDGHEISCEYHIIYPKKYRDWFVAEKLKL